MALAQAHYSTTGGSDSPYANPPNFRDPPTAPDNTSSMGAIEDSSIDPSLLELQQNIYQSHSGQFRTADTSRIHQLPPTSYAAGRPNSARPIPQLQRQSTDQSLASDDSQVLPQYRASDSVAPSDSGIPQTGDSTAVASSEQAGDKKSTRKRPSRSARVLLTTAQFNVLKSKEFMGEIWVRILYKVPFFPPDRVHNCNQWYGSLWTERALAMGVPGGSLSFDAKAKDCVCISHLGLDYT